MVTKPPSDHDPDAEPDADADSDSDPDAADDTGEAGGRGDERTGIGTDDSGGGLRALVAEDRIVRVDLWVTGVFTVVSVGAAAWSGLLWPAVVVDLALFVAGSVIFLYAYLRGIGRSRAEGVTMAGLFFLADRAAPKPIARALRLLLGVQVVVAVATAAVRPFSSLAFGILTPMFGLGMLALWGAVHGRFPPRLVERAPRDPQQPRDGA